MSEQGIEDIEPLSLQFEGIDLQGLSVVESGGTTSARGFRAAGIHAGFRADPDRLDFAMLVADEPCAAAGVFTQNVVCAAPVTIGAARKRGRQGQEDLKWCSRGV